MTTGGRLHPETPHNFPVSRSLSLSIRHQRRSAVSVRSVFRTQSDISRSFMFTLDNTDGFSQKVLDQMNAEVKERMKKYDSRSKDYKKILEQVEDDVFDEFCTSTFRPSMKL